MSHESLRQTLSARLAQTRASLGDKRRLLAEERALHARLRDLGSTDPMTRPEGLRVSLASPCGEDWNAMVGDTRQRHCSRCSKTVTNLSGLTEAEARTLLSHPDGPPCVRYYVRRDGSVLTADCPVGRPKRIALRVLQSACIAGLLAATPLACLLPLAMMGAPPEREASTKPAQALPTPVVRRP